MIDDVRRRSVASGAAEPLIASETFDHAAFIVDSTIAVFLLVNAGSLITDVVFGNLRAGM